MAPTRSDLRRLRRECATRLAELDLPACPDLPALCGHLAAVRGRPLHVLPMALGAEQPCGLWLATQDADWIFHDVTTSRAHQEHIVLHEIGHMVFDHGGGHLDDDVTTALFPDLDPGLVRAMLARDAYSDEQEQQAEIMAYLLAESLRAAAAAPHDGVAARIAESLNHSSHPEAP